MRRLYFILLSLLALSACSSDLELPPAQAFSASAEQVAKIPGIKTGPYRIEKSGPLDWPIAGSSLRIRIVAPQAKGPFPLVVFSHGFASDIDQYDALFDHWASHGFIIIAPYHLDGGGTLRAIFNSLRQGHMGLIQARVDDVQHVLDHFEQLDSVSPGMTQRIDDSRIAIIGHSFGAFTAQQFAGAQAIDPEDGSRVSAHDPRVKAVIAISPPGEMFGVINAQSWKSMHLPMLATTGTWDVDGRFVTDWRQHKLSFESAQPGQNWLLVSQGADHYFGNLICRTERKQAAQYDALRMANAVSVSFLRAYLYDESAARGFLSATQKLAELSNGFSNMTSR